MQYLIIHNIAYEGSSLYWFNNRDQADLFLYKQEQSTYSFDVDDYELIEVTQTFDIATALDCYKQKRDNIREEALSKLSDEEIAVPGLVGPRTES